MKLKKTTKALIIICVIGLCILLYPSVSNYWNEKHATKAISNYVATLDNLKEEEYERIWNSAVEYNRTVLERENVYTMTEEQHVMYNETLDVSGTGIMGYIDIPKIDVMLPIYHGTSESVLQHAVGHLEWTSLPVGGESSHCVMSGHRGLPSAKLFTDLDNLREGDLFIITILNETLTYEVDQIRTVTPQETSDLLIEKGKDLCTLVTCTPYGINTHRLLVRGHRIENIRVNNLHVVSEAVVIDPIIVAPAVACPLLFIMLMMVMLKKPEKKSSLNEIAENLKKKEAESDKKE